MNITQLSGSMRMAQKESLFIISSRNNPVRDYSIKMGIFERDYFQRFYYQPLFKPLAGSLAPIL